MRAYFELTEKRERGVVLREDKQPISPDTPGPSLELESVGDGTSVGEGAEEGAESEQAEE